MIYLKFNSCESRENIKYLMKYINKKDKTRKFKNIFTVVFTYISFYILLSNFCCLIGHTVVKTLIFSIVYK